MQEVEPDRRLHRLLILSDGIFAISLTLLAVQLALPERSQDLRGGALLPALLATWPRALAYLNSFAVIAIFWQAHHRLFLQVRRFDGIVLWLVFLQLGCIGFIPFPTAVIGEHGTNPVAQQFYFGTLLVSSLAWVLLRWYATAGHRLVSPDLSSHDLRFYQEELQTLRHGSPARQEAPVPGDTQVRQRPNIRGFVTARQPVMQVVHAAGPPNAFAAQHPPQKQD